MLRALATAAALALPASLVTACGGDDTASAPAREIAISTTDELRFDPATLTARAGEKVTLVVSNAGRLDHEIVIGDAAYLDAHAEGGDHAGHGGGDGGASEAVPAGRTVRLTFTMPDGDAPSYACFVDRHDKAGMTGTVTYT